MYSAFFCFFDLIVITFLRRQKALNSERAKRPGLQIKILYDRRIAFPGALAFVVEQRWAEGAQSRPRGAILLGELKTDCARVQCGAEPCGAPCGALAL